jgi:hypothetical protein
MKCNRCKSQIIVGKKKVCNMVSIHNVYVECKDAVFLLTVQGECVNYQKEDGKK